jgi:hypothetical protein
MLTFTPVGIWEQVSILVEFMKIKLVDTFSHPFYVISSANLFDNYFFIGETTQTSMILPLVLASVEFHPYSIVDVNGLACIHNGLTHLSYTCGSNFFSP